MNATASDACANLERRAKAVRLLAGKDPHPQVADRLERAAIALKTCAEVTRDLPAEFRTFVEAKRVNTAAGVEKATSQDEVRARQVALLGSEITAKQSITIILNAADLIGRGSDAKALKALGGAAYNAAVKIALTASGIEIAKTLAELAGAATDLVDVKRNVQFRRDQAQQASEFLTWIDAVTAVAVIWLAGALAFQRVLAGKKPRADAGLARAVNRRIRATKP